MSRFGGIIGREIARGLRGLERPELDFNERTIKLQEDAERLRKEKKKRDAAYKRAFGVWPGETWR